MVNQGKLLRGRCLTTLALVLLAFGVSIGQPAYSNGLNVVELYTSHGCSSCPSADAYLADLIAADNDIIALEFHVDYWNSLIHGKDGSWQDPFSKAEYSDRQRQYNRVSLDGRGGVYTPQIIVNGAYAAVGSDQRRIKRRLTKAGPVAVDVSVLPRANGLAISLQSSAAKAVGANVWLVRYRREATTDITGGENRHLTLTNHHIVTDMQSLGEMTELGMRELNVAYVSDPDFDCAVLVQSAELGRVLGAAHCP